jgi:hypothetical protein
VTNLKGAFPPPRYPPSQSMSLRSPSFSVIFRVRKRCLSKAVVDCFCLRRPHHPVFSEKLIEFGNDKARGRLTFLLVPRSSSPSNGTAIPRVLVFSIKTKRE